MKIILLQIKQGTSIFEISIFLVPILLFIISRLFVHKYVRRYLSNKIFQYSFHLLLALILSGILFYSYFSVRDNIMNQYSDSYETFYSIEAIESNPVWLRKNMDHHGFYLVEDKLEFPD